MATKLLSDQWKCGKCNQRCGHCICDDLRREKRAQKNQPKTKQPPGQREWEKSVAHLHHRIEPITSYEENFRHGHWTVRRSKVRSALVKSGTNSFAMDRWDNCGSGCIIQWSESLSRHRVRGNYCKSKHCEPCMRAKSNLIAANLRNKLAEGTQREFRFLTFTLRHNNQPLKQQVQRLYKCFKVLRNTKLWKTSQNGGAFTLEVKRTTEANPPKFSTPAIDSAEKDQVKPKWHPHIHVISSGNWIDQNELRTEWLKITGDSHIVDVRKLDGKRDVAAYVCKYVAKGTSPGVWDSAEDAAEWIEATKGVRTCATYGSWRGFALCKPSATAEDWESLGRLDKVIGESRQGSHSASLLLLKLRPPGGTDFDACDPP